MTNRDTEKYEELLAALETGAPGAVEGSERPHGDLVVTVRRPKCHEVLKVLRHRGFDLLLDIAGVDLLEMEHEDRFQVVYNLYSLADDLRLRVKVNVPEDDMSLSSVANIWQSANWAEREAYDMFGFRFESHPNLSRILCHHEFEGHALRKDYPIMKGQWATSATDLMRDLDEE
ncbi:MAG: NADH-quinone oxidoreductase subunit C [Candidatus Krumholzibacteriia bacterium]